MQNYLICYDIFDKKRLYKVRKIVYSYALGGQKSALEAPLSKKELKDKWFKILEMIDYHYGEVTAQSERVYFICKKK